MIDMGKIQEIARRAKYQSNPSPLRVFEDSENAVSYGHGEQETEKSMNPIKELEKFTKGGPYIGPKGGKWADAKHTIPWKEGGSTISDHRPLQVGTEDVAKEMAKEKGLSYGENVHGSGWLVGSSSELKKIGVTVNNSSKKKYDEYLRVFSKKDDAYQRMENKNQAAKNAGNKRDIYVIAEHPEGWAVMDLRTAIEADFDYEWATKSMENDMNPIKELEEFAKGDFPSGIPVIGQGAEQGGSMDGTGKTSGSGDSDAGEPVNAPSCKKEKLSEDDEEDEKQMTTHEKPIEATRKSLTPTGQREQVARETAIATSKIRKGEPDVTVGLGVPSPIPAQEKLEKGREWRQSHESLVHYSNQSDLDATRLLKSDDFYINGSPIIGRNPVLAATVRCPACQNTMNKSLTACPTCNHGAVHQNVVHVSQNEDYSLVKSEGRGPLRPRIHADVSCPDGIDLSDE